MKHIITNRFSDSDKSILLEEFKLFKTIVKSFDPKTPFYVYSLCKPNGQPFYIGKGKNLRAWDHLKLYNRGVISDKLKTTFDSLIEPPIFHIIEGNLDETTAYTLEEKYISMYGRFFEGGSLDNKMPGGVLPSSFETSSIGGKIGGKRTLERRHGIFSESYDRSKQSKLNWENGIFDSIDFSVFGKIGGNVSYETKKGIHSEDNVHNRTDWAKIGARALHESGNRSGIFTKEWRESHPEIAKEISSKGGKVGGKVTGKMFWWNNGVINTKSFTQPDGFVRGMIYKGKLKNE